MRRDYNARMEQAWLTAALPNMKNPPKLKDMLVDVEAKPRGRQDWREMKAALQMALGGTEDGGQ